MAAQLQSTELDAIALNEQSLDALHYREMLFLDVDFAEAPTLPDAKSLAPEKLKQVQTAMVRFILQDGDRGYKGRIDQIEFDNGDPLKGVFSDGRTKPAKVFRYEIDGDRKVFSPASGFDFSEEPTLDFGGNKAFKKQPVCDKGWGPCGYRCLSREVKNCPSALEGQAKAYHEWLKTSPKAEDKGTLVGQAKAPEEKAGPKKPDNRTDEEWAIDQKYASPDPSDADIEGWRKEIAIATTKPDPAKIVESTKKDLLGWAVPYELDQKEFEKVKDAETFAQARYKVQQKRDKGRPWEPKDFGFPEGNPDESPLVVKAKTKLDNPKTKNKEKAKKDYEKIRDQVTKDIKTGEEQAARQNAIRDTPKEERLKQLEGDWNAKTQEINKKLGKQHEEVVKGKKAAIDDAAERGILKLDTFELPENYKTFAANKEQVYRDAVKQHLMDVASGYAGKGEASLFDLPDNFTPEELKKAYKKAALKAHPDTGGSAEAFRLVNKAYEKLKGDMGFSEYDPWFLEFNAQQEYEITIFRSGDHVDSRGVARSFSDKELQDIADTYNPQHFKAPLIVSHNTGEYSDRDIVTSELAFGFPEKVRKVGGHLKATFKKISSKFLDFIKDGQILGLSPSFYPPDHPSNPYPGKFSLRHIAGLGKSPPAVKGLDPYAMLNLSEVEEARDSLEQAWAIAVSEFDVGDDEEDCLSFSERLNSIEFCGMAYGGTAIADLWQNLREHLIDQESLEVAERVVPSSILSMLRDSAQMSMQPDWMDAFRGLQGQVDDLRSRISAEPEEAEERWNYSEETADFMDLGALKKALASADLGAIAKATKMSIANLAAISKGDMEPDAAQMAALTKALGMETKKGTSDMNELEELKLQLAAAEADKQKLANEVIAQRVIARRAQVSSFVEGMKLTPGVVNPQMVEFGEGDQKQSREIGLIDFMVGLSDEQLAYFKGLLNGTIAKTTPKVEFGEVAPERPESSGGALTEADLGKKAQALVREQRQKGTELSFAEAVDQVMKEYGIHA